MKKATLFLLLIFASITVSNAQKISIKKGSLAPLKGETAINAKFTYDNMRVGKMSEQEYLEKK